LKSNVTEQPVVAAAFVIGVARAWLVALGDVGLVLGDVVGAPAIVALHYSESIAAFASIGAPAIGLPLVEN
jgi:hypothetical protein